MFKVPLNPNQPITLLPILITRLLIGPGADSDVHIQNQIGLLLEAMTKSRMWFLLWVEKVNEVAGGVGIETGK